MRSQHGWIGLFAFCGLFWLNSCENANVPNPPKLLSAICNPRDVAITWEPTGDNGSPITSYAIQYNTSFTPDTWEVAFDAIPETDHAFRCSMSPWANYTFRIIARNKVGPSLPSDPSNVCTTEPDVPYKNPDKVEVKGTKPCNLVITWTPMPEIDHNDEGFHYVVYWKKNIPGKKYTSQDVMDWKSSQLVIPNQPPLQKFRVRVIAVNRKGEANVAPMEVEGYSGEADVPNPPKWTSVICNPKNTIVSWEPTGDNCPPITSFIIQYKTNFAPDGWKVVFDSISPTDRTFNCSMFPRANYTFRIIARNKLGPSIPSDNSIVCTSEPDVPYKNPDNVEVMGAKPGNLVITWTPIPEIDHNDESFHYVVYWKKNIPGEKYTSQDVMDWKTSQLVIPNQPALEKYIIKVKAINRKGEANVDPMEVIGYSGEADKIMFQIRPVRAALEVLLERL